ncbi:MAG TPA: T9SS type A sorting domain-containing protein [Chitinophagaceae bacterium]|nr:T9SS type A sorting domain-containing protein [Chitinophagaceae bacterium]
MKTILTFMRLASVVIVMMLITTIVKAQAVNDYRTTGDANWGTLSTWERYNGSSWQTPTAGQGYPGQFNTPGTVTILNADDVTLNVSPTNSIGNLVLEAGNSKSSLTFTGTNSLTTGDITINSGTGNGDHKFIAVNAGSLTCSSVTMQTTGNDNHYDRITISTGTVTVTGDITMNDADVDRNYVEITGAGTLNVLGGITGGDLVLANSSTVNYNGAAQTIRGVTYGNLILSGSGVKTMTGVGTVNGSMTLSGTATATTAANFTIGSSLNVGTGTTITIPGFNITVSGTTTIDGTLEVTSTAGTKTFDNIIINSGGSFNSTVNENYSLTGNLQVNGSLTAGTGTWTWTASGAFSGTATIDNLVVSGGGTVTLTNNGTLTSSSLTGTDVFTQGAAGVLNYSGTTIGVSTFNATNAGNIVNYNATGAQTVRNVGHSNIYLSGSGVKTLNNFAIGLLLSIQGSATTTGATPNYNAAAVLEYKGSVAQTTSNNEFGGTGANPSRLRIDNPLGVTLNAAKTINTALTLVNGELITTSTFYLNLADNATASGGSNSSYVSGPLRKTGNDPFTFPIGKSGLYSPLTITNPNSTSDAFEAEYMRASGSALGGITSPGLYRVSNCEYWVLDQKANGAGADDLSVTVGWFTGSGCGGNGYITDISGVTLAHFNTGTNMWDTHGGTATGNPTTGTVTRTNVTVFSPFTLGSTIDNANPLPVKFSGIKAFEKQSGIQLDWTAYQEENVDMYEVERSADGVLFVPIGTVDSRNSVTETKYSFFDAAPLPGVSFYRLRNVDIDGKSGYSNIVKVSLDKSVKSITIYPNPVRGEFISLQSSDLAKGNYSVRIMNAAGQQVYNQRFSHTGGAINETIQLPSGMQSGIYILQLDKEGAKVMAKAIVVQQ